MSPAFAKGGGQKMYKCIMFNAGENSIVVVPGANMLISPEDITAAEGLIQGIQDDPVL